MPNLSEQLVKFSEKSANNTEFPIITAKTWTKRFDYRRKSQNREILYSSLLDVPASGCLRIIWIEHKNSGKQ